MRTAVIDLTRCKRCQKRPRGKLNLANFERYHPFCSFHCQEWHRLEEAQRYINAREQFNGPER